MKTVYLANSYGWNWCECTNCCGRQEEPVILISRLLLCIRRMYVASIRFGLPLRMNGMHKTQFDHARFDLLPLVTWSRVSWPSVTRNLRKAQRWNNGKTHSDFRSLSPVLVLLNLWLLVASNKHQMTFKERTWSRGTNWRLPVAVTVIDSKSPIEKATVWC